MAASPCSLQSGTAFRYLEVITRCPLVKVLTSLLFTTGYAKSGAEKRELVEDKFRQLEQKKPGLIAKLWDALIKYFLKEIAPARGARQVLCRDALLRAEVPNSPGCEAVIQLLLSDNVFVMQCAHESFILISALVRKFHNIKTLISYEFSLNYPLLDLCLPMFPNLTVLKARLSMDDIDKTLEVIRRRAPNLQVISLPKLRMAYVSTDSVSRFLFNDAPYMEIEKKFALGESVKVSFSKLRYLSLPFKLPVHLAMIRMTLFCYADCHVDWLPDYKDPVRVSAFDSLICPTIDLVPSHALQRCELRFEDLRFPYIEEIFEKWENINSLRFLLGQSCVSMDLALAQRKLASIFSSKSKLTCFQLMVLSSNVDRGIEATLNVLKKSGHKIREFVLVDNNCYLTHKDIIDFINCFPGVEKMHLECKPTSRYHKEAKIIPLSNLTTFRVHYNPDDTSSKTKISSMIITDILKESPNLITLTMPYDDSFRNILQKGKIIPSLKRINFYIYSAFLNEPVLRETFELLKRSNVTELSVHAPYLMHLGISGPPKVYRDNSSVLVDLSLICHNRALDARYFSDELKLPYC
ncbi:uncharacterized protein LOC108678771 [Hyalella azteca]|uniref:Uncharacterized protein LOC108678771 n=1 Tax=Hyalella azteca TaxID=294128 RepID=A0A8B7P9J1_HYAAZ|nr:uncharacterized protein LOC108678771 [Hyalella azteca]